VPVYAYVDRPVTELGDGGRFLLHAMRGWLHAASRGQCPPGLLAPLFARAGALPALPAVNRLMVELNASARDKVAFLPVCAGVIGDDEAVLLQLWHDARLDPPHAQRTLALLLQPEATGAFDALLTASARLGEAGLADFAMRVDAIPGAS
jgi:hypothetical protein